MGDSNFSGELDYFRFVTITLNFMLCIMNCRTLLIYKPSDYRVGEL